MAGAGQGGGLLWSCREDPCRDSDVHRDGGQLGYPLRTGPSWVSGDERRSEVDSDRTAASNRFLDRFYGDDWIAVRQPGDPVSEEPAGHQGFPSTDTQEPGRPFVELELSFRGFKLDFQDGPDGSWVCFP